MNAYITLDYELGMGQSGTQTKCLFEPMNHLTRMLDNYGIKTNIFVDAAYLLRLKKLKDRFNKLQVDYTEVTEHIKKLEEAGHSIQLHLHPQWCYSEFDGQSWVLDKDHYKLSDMPIEDQKQLIHEGVELLNGFLKNKVKAFRAGGYSIENFKELYDTFIAEGIVIDSSVFRGERAKSKYQTYDYRRIPLKTSYCFEKDFKKETPGGKMKEYPLSTIVVSSIPYLINKYSRQSSLEEITDSKEKWGDAVGIGYPGGRWTKMLIRLRMLFGKKAICTYIEEGANIEKVYNYSVRKYEGDDFVIIGHPKGMSPFSIAVLERFIINHPEVSFKVF